MGASSACRGERRRSGEEVDEVLIDLTCARARIGSVSCERGELGEEKSSSTYARWRDLARPPSPRARFAVNVANELRDARVDLVFASPQHRIAAILGERLPTRRSRSEWLARAVQT